MATSRDALTKNHNSSWSRFLITSFKVEHLAPAGEPLVFDFDLLDSLRNYHIWYMHKELSSESVQEQVVTSILNLNMRWF